MHSVYQFLLENREVVAFVLGVLALSYPKLPHPDKYLGTNWYFPYLVLHSILARVSVLEWNKVGGALKVPGSMSPSLEEARHKETLGNLARSLQAVQADLGNLQNVSHLAESRGQPIGTETLELTPVRTKALTESMKVEK
jgi:hypothetical protein